MTSKFFALTVAAVVAACDTVGPDFSTTTPISQISLPAEGNAPVPLDELTYPTSTLTTAKVEDQTGQTVGELRSVVTNLSGKPTEIQVDVGDNRTVSVDATNFTYIPKSHVLRSRMSKAEVEKLPLG